MRTHLLLAMTLVFVVMTGGCLFPPVEVDPDQSGPDDPLPTAGPRPTGTPQPGFVRAYDDDTVTGQIDQGASTPFTDAGTQRHAFDLPGRVEQLHLRFEWDDDTADLDLVIRLLVGGEQVWGTELDEGSTGDPDSPVDVTFTPDDVPQMETAEADMLLQLDVSAKAAVETGYTLYGEWWYLRPA